jgi:DoxX-like family
MSTKTKNIVNWVLAGLVGFIFLGSAFMKISGGAEAVEGAKKFGIDAGSFTMIGIVELISIILFLIPRTGILGTLLLVAYMGGAIATHLEHGESIAAPVGIAAFVWIVAVVRFPELTQRIMGKA